MTPAVIPYAGRSSQRPAVGEELKEGAKGTVSPDDDSVSDVAVDQHYSRRLQSESTAVEMLPPTLWFRS